MTIAYYLVTKIEWGVSKEGSTGPRILYPFAITIDDSEEDSEETVIFKLLAYFKSPIIEVEMKKFDAGDLMEEFTKYNQMNSDSQKETPEEWLYSLFKVIWFVSFCNTCEILVPYQPDKMVLDSINTEDDSYGGIFIHAKLMDIYGNTYRWDTSFGRDLKVEVHKFNMSFNRKAYLKIRSQKIESLGNRMNNKS